MELSLQVKQFVAMVTNVRGVPFMVFRTGSEKHYLFCQCYPLGAGGGPIMLTGTNFPIAKSQLTRMVAMALNNGRNFDAREIPAQMSEPSAPSGEMVDGNEDAESLARELGLL